jgi:hypothetical protein
MEALFALVAAGTLEAVISDELAFEDANEAIQRIKDNRADVMSTSSRERPRIAQVVVAGGTTGFGSRRRPCDVRRAMRAGG